MRDKENIMRKQMSLMKQHNEKTNATYEINERRMNVEQRNCLAAVNRKKNWAIKPILFAGNIALVSLCMFKH